MKSEPEVYSMDHLKRDGKTVWDCVRNFQARNFMRDEMSVGDLVFFYHSNADPSGIAGVMKILRKGIADPTQFDAKGDYYEPRASQENPVWFCVEVGFVAKWDTVISLETLRKIPELKSMLLLRRGQRLSVQPVKAEEWEMILSLKKAA